jgi:hypothetical protein
MKPNSHLNCDGSFEVSSTDKQPDNNTDVFKKMDSFQSPHRISTHDQQRMPEPCQEEKNRFHHINSSYDDSSQLSSILQSSHGNKSDFNSIGDSIESVNSAKFIESA